MSLAGRGEGVIHPDVQLLRAGSGVGDITDGSVAVAPKRPAAQSS